MNAKTVTFLSSVVLPLATIPFLAGCRALGLTESGYLSDYSKLQEVSDDVMAYRNPRVVPGTYQSFIVERVAIHVEEDREGHLTEEQIEEISEYLYAELTKLLTENERVVSRPGPGVARIRIAVTDVQKSKPLANILPWSRISSVGRGGAVLEGEMVDSQTGEQLLAVVRRTRAGFFSSSGLTALSDVKHAIDQWLEAHHERMEELRALEATGE